MSHSAEPVEQIFGLPEELLHIIVGNVDLHDLAALRLVNKRWCTMVSDANNASFFHRLHVSSGVVCSETCDDAEPLRQPNANPAVACLKSLADVESSHHLQVSSDANCVKTRDGTEPWVVSWGKTLAVHIRSVYKMSLNEYVWMEFEERQTRLANPGLLSKDVETMLRLQQDEFAITCVHQLIQARKTVKFKKLAWCFYYACQHAQIKMVQYLLTLRVGQMSDIPSGTREFPWHFLAWKSDDGSAPIYIAGQNGHTQIIEYLLTLGQQDKPLLLEATFRDGYTALYIASQNGRLEAVKTLLHHGANPNAHCSHGSTPLYIAAQQNRLNIVNLLLQHPDVYPDQPKFKQGFTALYVAARNGCPDIVKRLYNAGADPMARDGDGSTPLYVASQNGHHAVVEFLLRVARCPAEGPAVEFLEGFTPLYIASQNGHEKVIKLLLQFMDHPNHVCGNGSTPIYVACQNGHTAAVEALLERADLDVNLTFGSGYTPLYIAAQKGHYDICKALLRKPTIMINFPTVKGATALYVAAQKNHQSIVRLFLEHGAAPNIQFQNGFTALHIAAQEGSVNAVQELLKCPEMDLDLPAANDKRADEVASNIEIKKLIQEERKRRQEVLAPPLFTVCKL